MRWLHLSSKIMSDKIIHFRINVEKINREWFFKGEKGKYMDCTLFLKDTADQYGNNGMITQTVPSAIYKAEVEKKLSKDQMTRGEILGNAKIWERGAGNKEASPGYTPATAATVTATPFDASDLPF